MCKTKCQWCSAEFETKLASKIYCSAKCRNDFGNFMCTAGKALAPIAMTWRKHRGAKGSSADALKEMCTMLDKINAQYSALGAQPIEQHFNYVRTASGITRKGDK